MSIKIISLNNPYNGCDYHRIKMPVTYLHRAGLVSGVPDPTGIEDSLSKADILFYNRMPYGVTLDQVLAWREKYGFKLVVDIDDYWMLYPGHYLEPIWYAQKFPQQIIANIQAADAVTCTTDRLRYKVLQYSRNVYVVPNGLPYGEDQFTPDRLPSDRMRFVYCGGGSHLHDVRLLADTMAKLARNQFSGEVILAGIAPGVDIYQNMISAMSGYGKLKHFRWMIHQPLPSYMNLYNDGDVAMAPLVANEFNAHKSNLKVLEAGCKRMPIIVSNTAPYADDGNQLLLRADRKQDWYRWIRYCEANPNFVADNGAALHEYVKMNYDLRILNYLRMEAFENVLYGKSADNQPIRKRPGVSPDMPAGS